MRVAALGCLLICAIAPTAADAKVPTQWPPVAAEGTTFVHFGEEHVDDEDGELILPAVARSSLRFNPVAVLTSADKASDGTAELFGRWRAAMAPFDAARVPYFSAVGNHDRTAGPGFPNGIDPFGSLATYQTVFADRPYPFGDAPPVADSRFEPRARPVGDPAGASSHYTVDIANARWIFLDNSCFSLTVCDPQQNPPFPDEGSNGQLEYLANRAAEAKAAGRRVFVVMHMPTQDPRPGHTEPTSSAHTMGEGVAPDNAQFEAAAASAEIDGVFLGHVKGQWTYEAQGVPYFTDGGAGGEVYVGPNEETGVDYGYWHGFRVVHVAEDGTVTSDAVPVFATATLDVKGRKRLTRGKDALFSAKGQQPTVHGPDVVLELRDPAADRPNRPNLPSPARIWTTSNPLILRPVAGPQDDARRDHKRQTATGRFVAACPGRASVAVTAGTSTGIKRVTVRSARGRIFGGLRARAREVRRGRATRVATLGLAQPARVRVRVRRRGRTVRTLVHRCAGTGRVHLSWDGRGAKRAARYTLKVRVLSDRKPVVRSLPLKFRP